jgi:hypothetical protein
VALPAGAASLDEADAAIELWEFYEKRKLDDGQRLDVYVMMATRSDGLWAAGVTGHEKPRQSGKGDAIEVVEFWGLTQRSERILHTIHDAVLLATETQSRMLSLFEHPDLRRLKSRAWKGTGQQMIEMRGGGIDGDVDEFLHLRLQPAMLPGHGGEAHIGLEKIGREGEHIIP